jgi:hypothetical protein
LIGTQLLYREGLNVAPLKSCLLRFPCQPDFNPSPDNTGCVGRYTESIPFEQCIESYDVTGSGGTPPSPCPNNNPSGKLLRTVIKGWYAGNAYSTQRPTLDSVQTTLDNNQSSLTVNCYNTSQEMTETDEYDLGTSTPTLPTCATGVPSGAVSGPLLRKTTTAYASFTGTNIVDLPSSVITYNGSGTRVAESDSSYDQSSLQTTSVVQHVTAPGGSARGNTTTVTKQCFVGSTACSIGNSVTTYSYYDTGQIYQMTDPCGNGTCSDVSGSNHTTTYSYTDSYTPCSGSAPPNGATNAYLTQ